MIEFEKRAGTPPSASLSIINETLRRRIMSTSSLNKISVDQLGNKGWGGGGVSPPPDPFYIRDGFFKLLRSPRIDSKESIPPAYGA